MRREFLPLNPTLYEALNLALSRGVLSAPRGRVGVTRIGQPTGLTAVGNPLASVTSGRQLTHLRATQKGEAYWVNCPHCGDTRGRLSIDHMWNTPNEQHGGKHLFLLNCFNASCFKTPGRAADLADKLQMFNLLQLPADPKAIVRRAKPRDPNAPLPLPGPTVRLDELPPDHPACRLLRGRGFDPVELGQQFGASFCPQSKYAFAGFRIIFPVFHAQKLVGWQARYVDNDGGGDCSLLARCTACRKVRPPVGMPPVRAKTCPECQDRLIPVPKYWTGPDFQKSEHLFNFDAASQWPIVVISEGPLDVCRIGTPQAPDTAGPGVALFGKTLSYGQRSLLIRHWHRGTAVVLLDADAYADGCSAAAALEGNFAGGVLRVLLPDDRDPGECDHDLIWRLIRRQAEVQGLTLPI